MTGADLLEKLAALPRSQRLAVWVAFPILVLVAFWFMVYSPKSDELKVLDGKHQELVTQRDQVKKRAENREQFEAELEELSLQLKQALRELPNEREIPDLLKRISAVGKKAGLEIRKFQPLPEVVQSYYAEVPVALEVSGSYHEVAMFFDRLSKLGRIVSVNDIEMINPDDRNGKVYLKTTGKAVTYRFLTEEELKRNANGGARRGGKGRN